LANRSLAGVRLLLAILGLLAAVCSPSFAATETYGYDALGRLIRWVDAQGRLTEYQYDAVGNILSVTTAAVQQNPTVASVTPSELRRGDTRQLTIAGTNLANTTVGTSHAGLSISGVVTAAAQVTLSLTVADSVPLGAQKLTLSLAAASADAPITILPRLPTLAAVPVPIAVPPDNAPRTFTLNLGNADTVAHSVSLAMSVPGVAIITPATLTFAPGEITKTFQVAGITGGTASAVFTSATLAELRVPVFVTAEFQGLNTTSAPS
jgi:YD repeat-containing protein